MCEAVERLVQREKTESLQMGMQQGMQKGMQKGIAETIKSLIKDGTLSKEKISQIVGLPIEKINEIASEI